MGLTRFSGPVYGGEQILAQAFTTSIAADASAVEHMEITVPATEDWYPTRAASYCTGAGNGATVDVQDDGTTVLATAVTLVANGPSTGGTVTADPGEYSGKRVAAGSALTFKGTNGATTAAANVTTILYGYKRVVS